VGNNAYGTLYGQPNVYCATEVAIPPEFTNIGQSLKDGLPYQPWAAELVKKTRAANRPNDPMSRCLPPGIVRLEVFPLFRKMVRTPATARSSATGCGWTPGAGSPLTDAARVTERFRRVNYGALEIELTIDDPKAYTRPWTIKVTQIIAPDTELLEYICLENEKDVRHLGN